MRIFLGYPQGTKCYKIYDLEHKRIVISRDVRFVKDSFPYVAIHGDHQDKNEVLEFLRELFFEESFDQDNKIKETYSIDENFNLDPKFMNFGYSFSNNGTKNMNSQATPTEDNDVREKRIRIQPRHLSDFVVNLPPSVDCAPPAPNQSSSTVYPLANFISYENFSDSHKAFLATISSNYEPKHFNEVVQDNRWK